MIDIVLLILAAVFAFANGVNDGGTLLATGLAIPSVRLGTAVAMLVLSVLAVPALLTTAVARTLSERLVDFGQGAGSASLLVALASTLAVVWLLSTRGLPTSLTLALVGALAGAGIGAGLPVRGAILGRVLLLAAIAPVIAALLAGAFGLAARFMPAGRSVWSGLARAHRLAFGAQCIAYGLNDGQKLLAVVALSLGTEVSFAARSPWPLALIGVTFAVGTVIGLRKVGATVGSELIPLRPLRAVITEAASAVAVTGTGIAGSPVSMTQSIVGGAVGMGMTAGAGRVRWSAVHRVGLAWVLTLPLAFCLAATAAFIATARW